MQGHTQASVLHVLIQDKGSEVMVFIGVILIEIAEASGLELFTVEGSEGILFVFMLIAFIGDIRRMFR